MRKAGLNKMFERRRIKEPSSEETRIRNLRSDGFGELAFWWGQ